MRQLTTRYNVNLFKWEVGYLVGSQFYVMATVPDLFIEEDEGYVYEL